MKIKVCAVCGRVMNEDEDTVYTIMFTPSMRGLTASISSVSSATIRSGK